MARRPRLIVLGRQGAGKGTQCAMLAARLDVPHVSTGDLLRAEVGAGTPLGRRAEDYLASGELVPDDLVLDLVAKRLGGPDARPKGYLLDGFPRTLDQGQALFEVLGGGAADLAIEIDVPAAEVRPRLLARRVCRDCGLITVADGHLNGSAPRCARCGGEIAPRDDDTPEAIERRLQRYDEQSGPLLIWLNSLGILVTVDGLGPPEEVHARLLATVGGRVPGALDRADRLTIPRH